MSTSSGGKGAAQAAPTLADLAEQVRKESSETEQMALDRAIHLGEMLRAARKLMPRGGWSPWLKDNYRGHAASARRNMQLADPANRACVRGKQSVAEAIAAIRKPKTTPTKRKPRESGKRLRALHTQKREKDSNLLIARVDIVKMVGILEAVDLPGLGFGDADDETVAEINEELEILFDWLDRSLTVAGSRMSEQRRLWKIRKLREGTDGRSPEEIATANRLADRLERKALAV